MKKVRRVRGIGEINENGDVIDKYQYEGETGFTMISTRKHNVIYSLDTQEKLFEVPKDVFIKFNRKVALIPVKYIKDFFEEKNEKIFDDELIGVFNSFGELLVLSQRVVLEKNFFKATKGGNKDKWGMYTYDGEEVFAKEYFFIETINVNISGTPQCVFYLASDEKRALFSSEKKLLIPWGFYDIKVNTLNNKVIVSSKREDTVYKLVLDEKGKVDIKLLA